MRDDPAQEAKGEPQQVAGEVRKQVGDLSEDAKDSDSGELDGTDDAAPSEANKP